MNTDKLHEKINDIRLIAKSLFHSNTKYLAGYIDACNAVERIIDKLESGCVIDKKGKNKTKIYTFTDESLEKLKTEIAEKVEKATMPNAIYIANIMYSAALLLSLRDELNFGKDRMGRIFGRIQHTFNALMTGEVNYYDISTTLREECGVNLVIERPEGVTIPADDIYKAMSGIKVYKVVMRGKK